MFFIVQYQFFYGDFVFTGYLIFLTFGVMSFIMFTIMDYMLDYIITSIFQVYHDILHRLNSISWKTVSRKFLL